MRLPALRVPALLLCLSLVAGPVRAASPQAVEFSAGPVTMHAQLFRPAGAGPFPTVIALHGCDGLGSRGEMLPARYRDWTRDLLEAGNAVLWPDSYGSRELGPQCRVREVRVRARRERVADIQAARAWLLKQDWVSRSRISLVGWANGANALLWAVRPQLGPIHPDFRAAVAFEPDCRISAGLGWSARVPTLLLVGESDDAVAPQACRQMIDGAQGRTALARIVVSPGPEVGRNDLARADSQRLVAQWLAR